MSIQLTEIEIDPDILALVPGFCKSREKDLQKVTEALEENNFDTIAKVSHTIKGIAAPYGFPTLEKLSRELEVAAKAGDAVQCREVIHRAKQYLSNYIQ